MGDIHSLKRCRTPINTKDVISLISTTLKIRGAEEIDIPAVLALIRAKAIFDGCLDALRDDQQSLREAFFSPQPKAKALVAEVEGNVIGVATYYDIYSSFLAKPRNLAR